jgi:hypothetical protein
MHRRLAHWASACNPGFSKEKSHAVGY